MLLLKLNELMASKAMIEALLQEPWFLALREINRRYECATYNQDGEKWIYFPQGSHDSNAVFKAQKLFPGVIQIEAATAAAVTHALNHG